MTINLNRNAGVEHEIDQLGRNQHGATIDAYNPADGEPQTCDLGSCTATGALPDGADDVDDGGGAPDAEDRRCPRNVVTIAAGRNALQTSAGTLPRPAKGSSTVSEELARAIKVNIAAAGLRASGKERDTDRLIRLGESAFLFHNHDREAFATAEVNGHLETWALRSSDFKHWLTRLYFLDSKAAPSANAMKESIAILESKAK